VVGDALRDELLFQEGDTLDDVWEHSPEAREDVRPMLADWGEVAQFLHTKRLVLDEPSRRLFLDHLYGDFAAALNLLIKRAWGDYSADKYALQFPKFENSRNTAHGPWQLFELWVSAVKPAFATIGRWRGGGGSGSSSGGARAPNGAGHSGGGLAAIFSSSTSVSTAARGGTVRGAPGPVAGTGLPLLFLFGGIAFLVVRKSRRNEAVTECPKGAETAE
jgi:hypothetical protein